MDKHLAVSQRKRVIVVTDGDHVAMRALRMAARRTGCHLIAQTEGNPTPLSGVEMVNYIREAPSDPVVVMLDDNGNGQISKGEEALSVLLHHPDIEVLAVLAVASNTSSVSGVAIDFSVNYLGKKVETAVDKDGVPINSYLVSGDTVDILRHIDPPLVIGIGDIGKMNGHDAPERGAPVTTAAFEWIILQSATKRSTQAHIALENSAYGEGRNSRR